MEKERRTNKEGKTWKEEKKERIANDVVRIKQSFSSCMLELDSMEMIV